MPAFQTELDIINRALQHCRQERIESVTEHNRPAREMGFAYHKLREAELQANLWRFATRRTILYAITSSTKLWTPAAYAAGTTYAVGNIVTYAASGVTEWWESKVASNTGNTPAMGPYWRRYIGPDSLLAHDADDTYFAGDLVSSGGAYYRSLVSSNEETPPSAGNWLDVGGTIVALQILYPIGAGPATQTGSANVYRLPRGFSRQAPTEPKAGMYSYVGVAGAHMPDDWVFEGNYLVSGSPGPILMRYVADVVDVPEMNPLFCEVLAARLAEELAPQIADPEVLPIILRQAQRSYKVARYRAGTVNGIEIGPISPELDMLIACRQ